MATQAARRWRRTPYGWLSPDGQAFAERGAPMSGGGTAWLIWMRMRDDEIDTSGGIPVCLVPPFSDLPRRLAEVAGAIPTKYEDGWFVHRWDAGSFSEARSTALMHEAV